MTTDQLELPGLPPPRSPAPASGSDRAPNRRALEADAAAVLSWMRTSGKWPLLDKTVRFLTGRSLAERSSDILSAAMSLSDDELEALLSGVLERTAGYLGVAPPVEGLAPGERRALESLVTHARGAIR